NRRYPPGDPLPRNTESHGPVRRHECRVLPPSRCPVRRRGMSEKRGRFSFMTGWLANALLVLCAATVHHYRWALLAGAAGGMLWAVKAWQAGWTDLLVIELLLSSLQIRGFVLWKR